MDDLSHPEPAPVHSSYASHYTAPGEPIRTPRNAAEWSALVMASVATAAFALYVVELIVGMFFRS